MAHADVIVDVAFLQYGKHAPSNSGFKGIVDTSSLFGGYTNYTSREDATKNSVAAAIDQEQNEEELITIGSYAEYTSREQATEKSSAGEYFTMSNEGALYTEDDRIRWINKAKASFSKPGDIAWTVVVSMANYDLLREYGIKDQNDFSRLTKNCLMKSFREMHLDPKNMIWWEDYHTNTDHPHMHITFMEKEHTRDRGKFTEKEINALKRTFISQIAARKIYAETYGGNADEDLQKVTPLRQFVQKTASQLDYKTIDGLLSLYSQLPDKGRLQYNSVHMIPYRDQLDHVVDQILKVDSVQPMYQKFTTMLHQLDDAVNTAGGSTISHLYEAEDKKLRVQIANSVLNAYKDSDAFDSIRKKNSDWKVAHEEEIYRSAIRDLTKKHNLNATQSNVAEALLNNRIADAKQDADTLGDSDVDVFLKASCDLLSKDRQSGLIKLTEADKKGSKQAKHCNNYHRMSLGVPKRMYHTFRRKISPTLIHATMQHLQTNTHEVNAQIAAFAHNSDHINPAQRDGGSEELARETERIRDQEERERGYSQ